MTDLASGSSKVVYLQQTAGGVDGWTSLTGDPIITALDASSQYEIVPEITASGGGTPSRSAVLRAKVDPATFQMTGVYIIDGGAGYGSTPTINVVVTNNDAANDTINTSPLLQYLTGSSTAPKMGNNKRQIFDNVNTSVLRRSR